MFKLGVKLDRVGSFSFLRSGSPGWGQLMESLEWLSPISAVEGGGDMGGKIGEKKVFPTRKKRNTSGV